jgi:hypothetical protein
VQFSSRYYDFKRNRWVFGKAGDEDILGLLRRKLYWQTKAARGPVWMGDPTEALYVQADPARIVDLAHKLVHEGVITMEGEYASANASLMAQVEVFEKEMQLALAELEKKHAFERG